MNANFFGKSWYIFLNICTEYPQKRRLVDNIEVLNEEIVSRNGSFLRIKRWLKGVHPQLGTIVNGLTGLETLVEKDVIRPLHTFHVQEVKDASQVIIRGTDTKCLEQTQVQEGNDPIGETEVIVPNNQGSSWPFVQASL